MYPETRLRRYRKNELVRKIFSIPFPMPEKFIWPVFVVEGKNKNIPIPAMPGQNRMSPDVLLESLEPLVKTGIGGTMIFGVPDPKDKSPDGISCANPNGIVQKTIKEVKKRFRNSIMIWTDVCVCGYTSHGHCGIINPKNDSVDNDKTLEILAKMALSHAEAGADGVAPSAMMDGQTATIRNILSSNGLNDTLLMSYSTKFASSFYGPFREAANSKPGSGNRKAYQTCYRNPSLAVRESIEDEKESADILMVKPALCYLDIIAKLKGKTLLPLAAYNVSGEYSMLCASAERGWGDLNEMAAESISAISRAGADIIISYWANKYNDIARPYIS
jgi:porphobilinogen synthase